MKSEERWGEIIYDLKDPKIESSSCRCFTTSIGDNEEAMKFVKQILQMLLHTPQIYLKDIGPSSDRDLKKIGTGRIFTNQTNNVADLMIMNALFRGTLKNKGSGRTSIHYNADPATAELLLRIVISVNQLSICGAAADW